MTDSKKFFCVVAGLVGLGVALHVAFGTPAAQASAGAPVMVTNTPLPVSAAQSGGWNVNVANTPNVNIANSPAVTLAAGAGVRDADNPVRATPIVGDIGTYGAAEQDGCGETQQGFCSKGLFQVPDGKRLVIEYVSMDACLPSGQSAEMFIIITDASACPVGSECTATSRRYFSTLSAPAVAVDSSSHCYVDSSSGNTSAGQTVRLYANAGQVVAAGATRNKGNTGTAGYIFGISGYLVDAQ